MYIEAVSLHYVIQDRFGFLCAKAVQLDAVTEYVRSLGDSNQRFTGASAGIEVGCARVSWEAQERSNSASFRQVQRKIAEFEARLDSGQYNLLLPPPLGGGGPIKHKVAARFIGRPGPTAPSLGRSSRGPGFQQE